MSTTPTTPEAIAPAPRLALRPREAAQAIGMSERALWTLTRDQSSGIPHVHIGRSVRYPVRELRDWLAEQTPNHVKGGGR